MSAESHRATHRIGALTLSIALAACSPDDRREESASSPSASAIEPTLHDVYSSAATRASTGISGDYLRTVISEIASDRYAGRGPGSEGDALARQWLAGELERLGYQPAAPDGGWQQPFDLVGIRADMPSNWSFSGSAGQIAFSWWDQFIAASGRQAEAVSVENSELVFVGYGIEAPEYGWNDFKGRNLQGKMLLMLNNDPDWDPALFEGETRLYYGRWVYKYESAARQGAAGAIIIHTTASAGYPWQVVQTSWAGEQFELPASGEPRIAVKGWLTEAAAADLLEFAGLNLASLVSAAQSREFVPVPLGITTSIAFANRLVRTTSANVLGLLPGSDPELSREAVVITAHHDHLGVGQPDASDDRIYNGARDNGAGLAQVLAIARAIAELPSAPRRSTLVNFVGAEEQGLLGSEYYAEHPTFAPGRIAANINYDGGNIWGRTRDVTYIGKGKSSLDAIVDSIAARQGRVVKPDQFPDRGSFYRSDQFNFAKIGVPALFLNTGTDFVGRDADWGRAQVNDYVASRYHQPGDELTPQWNFEGMEEDARIGFWTALTIANAQELPAWNPGDEFEAARLKALREVDR